MKIIRLAACAVNQTPLDWDGNRDRLLAALRAARDASAAVVCLPELAITGYGCEDQFFSIGLQQRALDVLAELLPATRGMVVAFGLPLMVNRGLYNGAAVACDGRLAGVVLKQHLAGDGIHYEPRWFRKWPAGGVERVAIGGVDVPVGDLLFDLGGVRLGVEICRDAWVTERPGSRLAAAGADILLNPTASHFAFTKQDIRRRIVLEGSRSMRVSIAYANLLGNESGRAIFDGDTHIAAAGQMLAEGPRLSFADHVLTTADVDVEATRRLRAGSSEPSCPRDAFGGETVRCEFNWPAPDARALTCRPASWDDGPQQKHEEFARAVPLALFDYLRKSRARGFVVSLSGGADSSAVAVLVWLAVKLGVAELGRQEFLARLPRLEGLTPGATDDALVGRLLGCVYQSTRNSSDATRRAAATVAEAVGADFFHWDVDRLVDGYVALASEALGRELTWETDDAALQNIQARVRAPGAWLLANLRGAVLLTTCNRSEASAGYATMDGDTAGGVAPLAGIDKHYLRQWLRWMEIAGPEGVGPLAALAVVNKLTPTAELRPPSADQTDEDDLMPYPVLTAIERAAIRDKLTPVEAYQTVRGEFADYPAEQLGAWVERFYRLWAASQWKRERFAVSFHLDDLNVDPRTWCRFPVLSGRFERELADLREKK